jgi:hypothetical protein
MNTPFLVIPEECSEAVQWAFDHLSQSGLQVMQTFHLKAMDFDPVSCSCPHHGTEACECQMVVLLVYENGFPPASLVAHGRDGKTWFMLVDTPQQCIQAGLGTAIQTALMTP